MTQDERFKDLEGFLDEDYEGERHNLWDNDNECWIALEDAIDFWNERDKTLTQLEEHCRVKIRDARELQIPLHKIDYGGDTGYWRGYKEALQGILELMGVPAEEKVESERFGC